MTAKDSLYVTQEFLATDWDTSTSTVAPIYYRVKDDTSWSSWQQVAIDSKVVHNTGNETINGIKTFGSFPITPSANPTTNYETSNKKYVDDSVSLKANDNAVVKLTGDQVIDGVKTFGSFPITPSITPTSDYQVANKKYVDSLLQQPDYITVVKTANLTINTAETLIDFNTVVSSNNITNNAGEITVSNAGLYTGFITLWINQSANPVVWVWVEKYNTSTLVWETYRNVASKIAAASDTQFLFQLDGLMVLNANDKFRIRSLRIGGTGAVLESQTTTINGVTATQYLAMLTVFKV